MTATQLVSALKSSPPAALYLFLGPEGYRRRICRKQLVDAAVPEEVREEGYVRYDLDETSLRDVLDSAASYSLFATKRLIWVSNAEAAIPRGNAAFDERDVAALARYAGDPTPDTVVVFDAQRYTFESDDKAKMERLRKFYAAIPTIVEFPPYTADEARKLAADVGKKSGLKMNPALLETLAEALGYDGARIVTELEKLAAFSGGTREITEADIHALLLTRDPPRCLRWLGPSAAVTAPPASIY